MAVFFIVSFLHSTWPALRAASWAFKMATGCSPCSKTLFFIHLIGVAHGTTRWSARWCFAQLARHCRCSTLLFLAQELGRGVAHRQPTQIASGSASVEVNTSLFDVCLLMVAFSGSWPPWRFPAVSHLHGLDPAVPGVHSWCVSSLVCSDEKDLSEDCCWTLHHRSQHIWLNSSEKNPNGFIPDAHFQHPNSYTPLQVIEFDGGSVWKDKQKNSVWMRSETTNTRVPRAVYWLRQQINIPGRSADTSLLRSRIRIAQNGSNFRMIKISRDRG